MKNDNVVSWFWIVGLILLGIVLMQLGQVFTYGGAFVLLAGLAWGAWKLGAKRDEE